MSINRAFWLGYLMGAISVIAGATGATIIYYLSVIGG